VLCTQLSVCAFRRISILYNAQALHPDGNTNPSLSRPLQEQDAVGSVLTSVGLVLSPLRFDSQVSVPASSWVSQLTGVTADLASDCFFLWSFGII
jgi:hypothetical protein